MVYTIAIDGIIGCGKSSLISELARDFTCFPEPIHEWSLLSDFYNQMSTYAAPFQFQVLFSFHKMFSAFKNVNDKIIIERYSSVICYGFTFLDSDLVNFFSPLDNLTRTVEKVSIIDFSKPKFKASVNGKIE